MQHKRASIDMDNNRDGSEVALSHNYTQASSCFIDRDDHTDMVSVAIARLTAVGEVCGGWIGGDTSFALAGRHTLDGAKETK